MLPQILAILFALAFTILLIKLMNVEIAGTKIGTIFFKFGALLALAALVSIFVL